MHRAERVTETAKPLHAIAPSINGGAAPVFVSEADQKVYKLDGSVDAKKHLDYKVKVTGDVKGDTIKVSEIKKAS
jgi:hypothetical protein